MRKVATTSLLIGVLAVGLWAETPTRSADMVVGEKKLKGCLISQGGKFMLQERKGKLTLLTGSQELGTLVGHTVTAHGAFAEPVSGNRAAVGRSAFVVSKTDVVSDTCGADRTRIAQQSFDSSGKPSPNHFR